MDVQALTQAGFDALRGGDAATARTRFQEIVDAGGTPPWLLLARACNLLGDAAGEERALQGQLDADPRSLPALFAMGELKQRQGEDRAAGAFLRLAVRYVSVMPSPPAELRGLAERAVAFIDQANRRYEAHLTGQLADRHVAFGAAAQFTDAVPWPDYLGRDAVATAPPGGIAA